MKKPWKTILTVLGHIWLFPFTLVGLIVAVGGWTKWHRLDKENWGAMQFVVKPGGLYALFFKKKTLRVVDAKGNIQLSGVGAVTLGAVVVCRNVECADSQRLRVHEGEHVRQGLILGIFQPVFYGIGYLNAEIAGQEGYYGNDLEEGARKSEKSAPAQS